MKLISPLADKEKKLFVLAKRQSSKEGRGWIVKLQCELHDLNNELYWATRAAC